MPREDEIQIAAEEYAIYTNNERLNAFPEVTRQHLSPEYSIDDLADAFNAGAKWADEHPTKKWAVTTEEIRKVAIEARCAVATSLSGDGYSSVDLLPEWVRKDLSYDEFIEESFAKGAEWADKHYAKKQTIWHSANEVPQKGGQKCLVKELNGGIDFYIARPNYPPNFPYFENGRYLIKMNEVDKWAYLDDILNL